MKNQLIKGVRGVGQFAHHQNSAYFIIASRVFEDNAVLYEYSFESEKLTEVCELKHFPAEDDRNSSFFSPHFLDDGSFVYLSSKKCDDAWCSTLVKSNVLGESVEVFCFPDLVKRVDMNAYPLVYGINDDATRLFLLNIEKHQYDVLYESPKQIYDFRISNSRIEFFSKAMDSIHYTVLGGGLPQYNVEIPIDFPPYGNHTPPVSWTDEGPIIVLVHNRELSRLYRVTRQMELISLDLPVPMAFKLHAGSEHIYLSSADYRRYNGNALIKFNMLTGEIESKKDFGDFLSYELERLLHNEDCFLMSGEYKGKNCLALVDYKSGSVRVKKVPPGEMIDLAYEGNNVISIILDFDKSTAKLCKCLLSEIQELIVLDCWP